MKTEIGMAEPLRVGIPEAARLLGVSRARLYEHMKAGAIRSVKDGARTLFTMAELRAFVARNDPNAS
jgi:excisionase family DNA binding protein